VSLVKNAKRYESPGERLLGTMVIGPAEEGSAASKTKAALSTPAVIAG